MRTEDRRQAPETPSPSWSPASIYSNSNWRPSGKEIFSLKERDRVLVTLQGFGNIWERKPRIQGGDSTKVHGAAYYNTTGVLVNGRVRYRWRIGGKIRFNSTGGFNPNYPSRVLGRVFECDPPERRGDGWNQMLFRTALAHPMRPDAYLFVMTPEKTGRIELNSPDCKPPSGQVG